MGDKTWDGSYIDLLEVSKENEKLLYLMKGYMH